jgi:tripartite-type tricarboxylate transporter receptor subunit TctC
VSLKHLVFVSAILTFTIPALAQDYPDRTIRLISPAAPGGGNDIFSRLAAQKLSDAFGKPVIVENRAGGGTIIGTELVAKAPPDGHTLIMVTTNFIINPALVAKLPYDSVRDLAPVALLASAPLVLVVHPSVPATSVKDLVALAKSRPGELNYASSGNGTAGHLAGVLLGTAAGIKLTHIPYKSSAPALIDLISGQVQMLFVSSPSVRPHIDAKRLRALAVTSAKRSSLLPQQPTVSESGLPGYQITQIFGMLAPGATPPAIVEKLNTVLNRALKTPDVVERLRADGAEAVGGSPESFALYIKSEIPKWIRIIRQSGARVD